MNLFENIRLALGSLRAGKMRAFLTMLGIIIGISSVIAIVTVGNSLTHSITDSMDQLGANEMYAYLGTRPGISWRQPDLPDMITDDMLDNLANRMGGRITAIERYENAGSAQVKDGRKQANVWIFGTSENGMTLNRNDIIRGRDISLRDVKSAKSVAVVSNFLADKMFAGEDPIGKELKVHTSEYGVVTFRIIGVYSYTPPAIFSSFETDGDVSTSLGVPITAVKRIKGSDPGYEQFSFYVAPDVDSYKLCDDVEEFFEKYYKNNTRFRVYTQNNEGMLNQMTGMLTTLSIAISIIAAISLLVGGIGVMNIMLVSVTERTREIGTRKALGARNSAIRIQFIIESMIICLIGGAIGILLGLGLGGLGATLMGFPASPSMAVVILAVSFSMVIGVFFGFYPANKAAKLDPIEALRYE